MQRTCRWTELYVTSESLKIYKKGSDACVAFGPCEAIFQGINQEGVHRNEIEKETGLLASRTIRRLTRPHSVRSTMFIDHGPPEVSRTVRSAMLIEGRAAADDISVISALTWHS